MDTKIVVSDGLGNMRSVKREIDDLIAFNDPEEGMDGYCVWMLREAGMDIALNDVGEFSIGIGPGVVSWIPNPCVPGVTPAVFAEEYFDAAISETRMEALGCCALMLQQSGIRCRKYGVGSFSIDLGVGTVSWICA